MRKDFYYKIVLSLIVPLVIVIALFGYAKYGSYSKNSFVRLFPPHVLTNFQFTDLGYNSYYFCGRGNQTIYLGNYTAPLSLLSLYKGILSPNIIKLSSNPEELLQWEKARVFVDSPDIYLAEGGFPKVFYTRLPDTYIKRNEVGEGFYFDQTWISTSPASIIVREYDTIKRQNILSKKAKYFNKIANTTGVLEKQVDGRFCTDGVLLYNRGNPFLIYVYNYRNQFIKLDTDLNVLSKFKTIDTNSFAKIKLDTVFSEKRVSFSSPPFVVNKRACIDGHFLFIHSGLPAKNEKIEHNDSDIDIYDLNNGRYLYSVTIPSFRDAKIKSIAALNNKLYLIFDRYLITYDLNLNFH